MPLSWQSRARSPTAQWPTSFSAIVCGPCDRHDNGPRITCDAIFAALLPHEPYDEHGSDEFAPGHFPYLLLRDGEVLGTVRIDLIDERAAGLRLIGIRPDVQRQGHGRTLLKLAEEAARALGRTEIVINAHPTSLEFYLAYGYREGECGDRCPLPSGPGREGNGRARDEIPPHR